MSAVNSRPNVDKMQNQIFDFYIFEDFHKAPVLTSEHLIQMNRKLALPLWTTVFVLIRLCLPSLLGRRGT